MKRKYDLSFMKAEITTMTLEEFRTAYAINDRRRHLIDELLEELKVIARQCRKFSIIVFGSYITDKDEPDDIDVLISLLPKKECVFAIMKEGIEKEHQKEVDIQFQRGEYYTKSAESLIDFFNENPFNLKKGIRIRKAVELLVSGCYGETQGE